MSQQQQKKPTVFYKVDWIGQDPNYLFSKRFTSGKEALNMANKNAESVAYKMIKSKGDTAQFQIIPTEGSKEMIKAIKLKRSLREKSGFSNFVNDEGIGEVKEVTTSEFQMNQKVRLASVLAISGALIYAGSRKEALKPWLRYSLMGLGGVYALLTLRNYKINKNV